MGNKFKISLKVFSLLFILLLCLNIASASDNDAMKTNDNDLNITNDNSCNIDLDLNDKNMDGSHELNSIIASVEDTDSIMLDAGDSGSSLLGAGDAGSGLLGAGDAGSGLLGAGDAGSGLLGADEKMQDQLKSSATISVVHTGNDLSDIQTAINNANVGDTILLGDYSYQISDGQINITKNITLKGNGANTFIQGTGGVKVGCILEIKANGATIEGIIMNNTEANLNYTDEDTLYGWAIRLDKCENIIIRNCSFLNFNRCVNIDASNRNTISGCYMTGTSTRVTNGNGKERGTRAISFSSDCKYNNILNNTFDGPVLDAINIDAASYTTISGNYFINNAYSIFLDQSATSNSVISNNTFIDCGHFEAEYDGSIISFQNLPVICAEKSFDNLKIIDNVFYASEKNIIISCKVTADIGNVTISGNTVKINENANASAMTFIKYPTEKSKLSLIGEIKLINNHLPANMILEEYSNEKIIAEYSTIKVIHTGNDSRDIQNAIDNAYSGDVVDLGNYNYANISTIKINKNLTIAGDNAGISLAPSSYAAFEIANESIEAKFNGINFMVNKNNESFVLNKVANDVSYMELSNMNVEAMKNLSNETISLVRIEAQSNILSIEKIKFSDNNLLKNMKTVSLLGNLINKKTDIKLIFSNMNTKTVDVSSEGKTGKYLTITLKDSENNPISGKKVKILLNGKLSTKTTNKNGQVKFQINLKNAGVYVFAVGFAGDSQYNGVFKTGKITVKKQKPKLSIAKKTFKVKAKSKVLKISFKSASGKAVNGKKITIKLKGKTYSAKTNKKGIAKVKVKLSKKGSFSFTAKFKGDKTFSTISKKGRLIVK